MIWGLTTTLCCRTITIYPKTRNINNIYLSWEKLWKDFNNNIDRVSWGQPNIWQTVTVSRPPTVYRTCSTRTHLLKMYRSFLLDTLYIKRLLKISRVACFRMVVLSGRPKKKTRECHCWCYPHINGTVLVQRIVKGHIFFTIIFVSRN